jgi:antitoxin MazE
MQTKIQKWGNSLAVRIPKAVADETGIGEETAVEMQIVNGEIHIIPIVPQEYDLDELLARITTDNRHEEVDTGNPTGNEVW